MKPHLLLLLLLVATTGCDAINNIGNERRDCSPGYPYVANPKAVPDTLTISLKGGRFEWDFSTLGIFKHTDIKEQIYYHANSSSPSIASATVSRPTIEQNVLAITPNNIGIVRTTLSGYDNCNKATYVYIWIKITP